MKVLLRAGAIVFSLFAIVDAVFFVIAIRTGRSELLFTHIGAIAVFTVLASVCYVSARTSGGVQR